MDAFRTALRSIVRGEQVDLESFEGEDRDLLARVAALVQSIEVLTEAAADIQAHETVTRALLERAVWHDPALRGDPS